jgi:hypothetical protein
MVLKRNPGIDSSLTQADVDGVNANLDYLQRKWRLSESRRSTDRITIDVYNLHKFIERFKHTFYSYFTVSCGLLQIFG